MIDCWLIFELIENLNEVLQFISIFEKVPLNGDAEEFDKHEVFRVYFAYGVVELLEKLFIEGCSVLYFLFLVELRHQFGNAHLLCVLYNFYGNVIYLIYLVKPIMLLILLLFCLCIQGAISRQLIMIQCITRHGVRYPQFPNDYDHSNNTSIVK